MKREFPFADQAFAFIDHVRWFFRCLYFFICRGGTLAAGQGNVVFLSVGLIGQQISRCRSKVKPCWPLCRESFDVGFARLIDQFSLAPQYLSALYPHDLGDGIFAIGKKCLHRAFF